MPGTSTGVDASPAMVELARQRLGENAELHVAVRISVISEPPFSPDTPRELLPPQFANRTAFLCFLFFVLEAT